MASLPLLIYNQLSTRTKPASTASGRRSHPDHLIALANVLAVRRQALAPKTVRTPMAKRSTSNVDIFAATSTPSGRQSHVPPRSVTAFIGPSGW